MPNLSLLSALTDAIVKGQIDVESARALVIQASSATQEELRQEVALYPTIEAACQALNCSRATLYRRMALSKKAGA